MERISVDTAGGEQYLDAAEPAVSKDGLVVAFTAVDVNALGPRQVYVRDRGLNTTTIVSHAGAAGPGNGDSATPALSGDGRFVAFASAASNLDSSDSEGFTDVFVFDRMPALLARASIDVDGVGGGNGHSRAPSLSADGQFLAYVSEATNVAVDDPDRPNGDGNGLADLILVTQPFAP
jgi:Tol biopolymer transport system component